MIALALILATTPQTQAALNAQAVADFRHADAALNAVYRGVVMREKAESAAATDALVAAQRLWVQFRDADCTSRSWASRGGSIHPLDELACRAELTRERTRQLKARADDRP